MLKIIRNLFGSPKKEESIPEKTPELFSMMFCLQLFEHHFGLSEDKRLEIEKELPDSIKVNASSWIVFYLGWLFRLKMHSVYGAEMTDQTFQEVYSTLDRMSKEYGDSEIIKKQLSLCFDQIDESMPLAQKLPDVPYELLVAQTLLSLDPSSPHFGKTEMDETTKKLGVALLEAKAACVEYIEKIVTLKIQNG